MNSTTKDSRKLSTEVESYGNRITDILEDIHVSARDSRSNRMLLASGFLCLAAYTLGGMSAMTITNKIVGLHYLLSNLDGRSPVTTSRANPSELSHPTN